MPDHIDEADLIVEKSSIGDTYAGYVIPADAGDNKPEREVYGLLDTNSTDALIDLLIWLKAQKEGGRR